MTITKKNKIGELTTQQLVILIILITSFAIILLLIFRLDLGQTTNKEICHNSVIMKGKSDLIGNLDCKITYVCISGGENCKSNYDIKKKIDLSEDKEEIKNQIMEIIAEEMANCWWMFGEGKVDYIGLDVKGASIGKINCAMCSRIKFSEDLKNIEIDSDFFKNFLKENKIDEKDYYSYYLYKNEEIPTISVNTDTGYYILTGIADKGMLSSIKESVYGSVSLINKVFFSFTSVPKLKENSNYGPIPVILKEEESIKDLECDEFLNRF